MSASTKYGETLGKLEENFEGYIAIVLISLYTLLIFYTVVQRVTFENPPSFTLNGTLFLFTWMVWVAAAWAIRHESHFRFSLARSKLSNRANYVLRYVDFLTWVSFAAIIGYYSIELVQRRLATGRPILGTPIPQWMAYLAIPVGMALIILRATQQIIIIKRKYESGEDVTPTSDISK
ncbi:TRAP transporter small permease [Halopenitus persicus]|uniref:C4-dicarboxylate transporter, DctQ subunit n=1 Tax=Halopenitus persicus TaxID=1048396 RepID=A0A1H3JXC3_9EURY|nr:TRAP transporter small permease [Halopenitus persicus]QHS15726.1 TRAP transporter small permease [haloarchaeon 3A1-DGR]SDY44269.1 C4-dicarboxylate transporter, DctQ subunit [Halopenitus persicus]